MSSTQRTTRPSTVRRAAVLPGGGPQGGGKRGREAPNLQEPGLRRLLQSIRQVFALSAIAAVAAVLVSVTEGSPARAGGTGATALPEVGAGVVVLAALLGARLLCPKRLLALARRAVTPRDPRELRPCLERARVLGASGLARRWSAQALVLASAPLLATWLLDAARGQPLWLLAGLACSGGLGWWLRRCVLAGVRGLVADLLLRSAYPLPEGPGPTPA